MKKDAFISRYLEGAALKGLRRSLRPLTPVSARESLLDGKIYLNFSSNNYLGLAEHPHLKEKSIEWTNKYGSGSTASRLVVGTYEPFLRMEEKVAAWKKSEAALIFGSGYLANIGVIPALAERKSAIFADRLNHASLNSGCQLARADCFRYKHCDLEHLSGLLTKKPDLERKIIISDTVFSMDGDVADVPALAKLAVDNDALLYLDDAHATGVFGENGDGLASGENIDIAMGTFSKALGCYGAYVACSSEMKEYLVNRCASFIYTTAPPPAVFGAIEAAIDLMQSTEIRELRALLMKNFRFLNRELRGLGYDTGVTSTPIIPVIFGEVEKALQVSDFLKSNGILAVPIRPPTVPKGSARIRLTLTAAHTQDDISRLLDLMEKCKTFL